MTVSELRNAAILRMIAAAKCQIGEDPDISAINKIKKNVEKLGKESNLFDPSMYPVFPGGAVETVYSLYSEPNGEYAVYLSSARHGMAYRPHDHGKSWAVVAVVAGKERHRLYERKDRDDGSGVTVLELAKDIVLKAGMAIAMMQGEIHSIEAVDDNPLITLHFYRYGFPYQEGRLEYDVVNKTCEIKINNDPIIDQNIYIGV